VGNRILMLEHSVYSVISPEGCAAILWSDGSKGAQAADALKLTAKDIITLGVIDEIVKEPVGGAHRDHECTAHNLKEAIARNLAELSGLSNDELLEDRYRKFRSMARFVE
jgi:acetyl-CoA carboxylase carboxyl transferase subunit alpha